MVKQKKKDRTFKTIVLLAILVVLVLAAAWFWSMKTSRTPVTAPPAAVAPPAAPSGTDTAKETSPPEAAPPEAPAKVASPDTPGGVIRYDSEDEDFKELMSRRKARFGLKESVDMIVESDETLQVGGISVPMEEILEKIRLKSGEMVETDLGPTLSTVSEGERIDRLYTQLKEKEKRFRELEQELETAPADAPETEEKLKEYDRLRGVMDTYEAYRKALSAIRDWELLLESRDVQEKLGEDLETLIQQKEQLEQTLGAQLGLPEDDTGRERALRQALTDARARMAEIDRTLEEPTEDAANRLALVRERTALTERLAALERHEDVTGRIGKTHALLGRTDAQAASEIESALEDLHAEADTLEDALADRLLPEERADTYGIYIVRADDNIWNIHFQFLKENFKYRGITLSPVADEPDERGVSSGVGKILKFAEGMVYIYNLQEQRLADDINIIHPLSKIIVFNMARAIELIKEIDREDIDHIQFDGETLWLPAG
jgi:hypothetical protein